MKIEDFKRHLLVEGYSLSSINSYAQGAKLYLDFIGGQVDIAEPAIKEIPFEYDGIILTSHAKERLEDRLNGLAESTFINLIETQEVETEYQNYEPQKAQHLFKVNISSFSIGFIGAIDSTGLLVVITIL